MSSLAYAVVDVFSTTPYKGNPLAVVHDKDGTLTDTQMKLITREFKLSETTFFSPPTLAGADYRLRSYLPSGREVFGAGHNILGAWWYLAHAGFLDLSNREHSVDDDGTEVFVVHQELGGVVLPVKILRRNGEISVSLRQAPPQVHAYHPEPDALATSFGFESTDIGFSTEQSPEALRAQVVSTSTTRHLVVPISSLAALDSATVQYDKLLEQLALVDSQAHGLYLFTPGPPSPSGAAYTARFFSPGMAGEDPATGSAAGPLAAYLYRNGHLQRESSGTRVLIHQGLKVGRECLIEVVVSESDGVLQTDIIGGGSQVATGQITAPDLSTTF